MDTLAITIDGRETTVAPRTTVLKAARTLGVETQRFCFVKGKSKAHCKICLVEIAGKDKPVRACVTLVREGMVVLTDTEKVRELRKKNLETLAETHFGDCKAPCNITCPGQINVQGYIAHVRKGEYDPMLLATGRDVAHYNFASMTRKTPSIDRISHEALAEIHPDDAEHLGISEYSWVRLKSRRGEVKTRATISDRVQLGTVFIPDQYAEVPINNLILNNLDKLSRSPQYKACAIS